MARILFIDTPANTTQAIRDLGHEVVIGASGYEDGQPILTVPPHEVDFIVVDLEKPACFDRLGWGEGKNDNYHATIVDLPTDEVFTRKGQDLYFPRYEILQDSHLARRQAGTFGPSDLMKAMAVARVPALLFLNPTWLQHVAHRSPNFFGVVWDFRKTLASRVTIASALLDLIPEFSSSVSLTLPLKFAIVDGPHAVVGWPVQAVPTITNAVGDVFGQLVKVGDGLLLATPPVNDKLQLVTILLERMKPRARNAAPASRPAERGQPTIQSLPTKDVFISYASEDKESVARPLAELLQGRGVSVWYDDYELRLGDSLRQKIDEGLRISRFGVTILSHNFFAKRWPQDELSGLVALGTRILPIWHGLTVDDVKQYSPTLADKVAARTSEGLETIASKIVEVVRDRSIKQGEVVKPSEPVQQFQQFIPYVRLVFQKAPDKVLLENIGPGIAARAQLQGFIFEDDQREEWRCTFEPVNTIQSRETVPVRFEIENPKNRVSLLEDNAIFHVAFRHALHFLANTPLILRLVSQDMFGNCYESQVQIDGADWYLAWKQRREQRWPAVTSAPVRIKQWPETLPPVDTRR